VTAMRRSATRMVVLLPLLTAGLVLAGCSGDGPAPQAVFRSQAGVHVNAAARPCQLHQTDTPTSAYRGGPDSDPSLELPFLAYFTANGDRPYCDGRPSTATDRAWAQLYVELTGNAAAVQRILSG
jgi:hypothetical protein